MGGGGVGGGWGGSPECPWVLSQHPANRPSRVRYRVLAFLSCLAAITYMDRVAISVTARHIMRDLHLSDVQMGFVFSAFTLAYGLFEIPTGWWGERIGTRKVLTRIVLWWSSFTIATAAAFSHGSLLVVRFIFGMGEAGAWPNAARTFSLWFPSTERGAAQGIFFAGAHFSAAITPLLVDRPARPPSLALGFRDLRPGRFLLGVRLAPLVSRRAGAASIRQCAGVEADRERPDARPAAMAAGASRGSES